jgi:hypothetical protein
MLTGWYDLRELESQRIHRLVMVVSDLAWVDGKWIPLDGLEVLEDD